MNKDFEEYLLNKVVEFKIDQWIELCENLKKFKWVHEKDLLDIDLSDSEYFLIHFKNDYTITWSHINYYNYEDFNFNFTEILRDFNLEKLLNDE